MADDLLLLIRTARCRYAARRDGLMSIQLAGDRPVAVDDPWRRPCAAVELGPLLDPQDVGGRQCRRALVVPLRRRLVALLVEGVDELRGAVPEPLPEILRRLLQPPWSAGVVDDAGEPIVLLDLRAVAMSIGGRDPASSDPARSSSAVGELSGDAEAFPWR